MNPTAHEQIQLFLNDHHISYSQTLVKAWHPDLETQVNVSAKGGKPVDGKRNTYGNGFYEWWNIRIPRQADSEPMWEDRPLNWPLMDHVEAIGTTWWNWKRRRSERVAFDFDLITQHAPGVGVTQQQLEEIKQRLFEIPYVGIRRSTSGGGLHVFIHFAGEGIPTENHSIHAALGRCGIGMMSTDAGFDFQSPVDQIGGNMWIYHRLKQMEEKRSFEVLKEPECQLSESDLPANWRDHADVIKGKRRKIRVHGIPDREYDDFEALASGRKVIQLDEQHRATIDALQQTGYSTVWNSDLHLLQTHTCAFRALYKDGERRQKLDLQGLFATNSPGSDPATFNVFAFPKTQGAWEAFRFGKGVVEHPMWKQDGVDWTRLTINRRPTLGQAAKYHGGVESKRGFSFKRAENAQQTLEALGSNEDIEPSLFDKPAELLPNSDGRTTVKVRHKVKHADDVADTWAVKTSHLEKILDLAHDASNSKDREDVSLSIEELDDEFRNVRTPDNTLYANRVRIADGSWYDLSKSNCVNALMAKGMDKQTAELAIGQAFLNPWTHANIPFGPEYPGNRQWNLDAAQFRFKPATLQEGQSPEHATWDMIFHHLGAPLDEAIKESELFRDIGIHSGYDYLFNWGLCSFRDPFEPNAYLFFCSPEENTGKSIYHEALGMLLTKGYVLADRTLTDKSEFNGELAGAILCAVEEKNLSKFANSFERLKKWVTSPWLDIRKMRMDTFQIRNTTHWVQCANDASFCPVFRGDTRMTVINVSPLESPIPKKELLQRLEAEAPMFMRTLLDAELPPIVDRLRLPVVETAFKKDLQSLNRDALSEFVEEHCYYVPGKTIRFKEFYAVFEQTLSPLEITTWNRKRAAVSLPSKFPRGKDGKNAVIGNLSFEPAPEDWERQPLVLVNGHLVPSELCT